MTLKVIPADDSAKQDALGLIEELKQRVEFGETYRFGLVECRRGSEWSTMFSSSDDRRVDGAMLIELGLRILGFRVREEE